jgi:Arf-GAP with coiled-coil, ANK repeat and PH domain-containing protein
MRGCISQYFAVEKVKRKHNYCLKHLGDMQYVEKLLIAKEPDSHSVTILDAIKLNNVKMAYRLIVANNINTNMRYYEPDDDCHNQAESTVEKRQFDPLACLRIEESGQQDNCMEGCSPVHFACHFADATMIELFLQFGSHIDLQDFHGRTPLHHCVFKKNDELAKYLLKR